MLGRVAAAIPFAAITGWCAGALAWGPSGPGLTTWATAAAMAGACTAVGFGPLPEAARHAGARAATIAALWGAVITWFVLVPPPADGEWRPDVAQQADFDIDGDTVTVSGIRNFRYGSSDAEFTPGWDDRTFDLRRIRTVDLFFSFWGPTLICHNFVSFGFERPDGGMDHVAVSIEARKRRGQEYSAIGGLFRQFTLAYVWADERDVVGVRARQRGERLRRYRVQARPENVRILFERYVAATMELSSRPRWYNAVTQNCGIDILRTAWGQRMPLFPSPRLLLNGTWEEDAWKEGRIFPQASLEETLRAADVTEDARNAADADFGRAIRRRDVEIRMDPPGKPPERRPGDPRPGQ